MIYICPETLHKQIEDITMPVYSVCQTGLRWEFRKYEHSSGTSYITVKALFDKEFYPKFLLESTIEIEGKVKFFNIKYFGVVMFETDNIEVAITAHETLFIDEIFEMYSNLFQKRFSEDSRITQYELNNFVHG